MEKNQIELDHIYKKDLIDLLYRELDSYRRDSGKTDELVFKLITAILIPFLLLLAYALFNIEYTSAVLVVPYLSIVGLFLLMIVFMRYTINAIYCKYLQSQINKTIGMTILIGEDIAPLYYNKGLSMVKTGVSLAFIGVVIINLLLFPLIQSQICQKANLSTSLIPLSNWTYWLGLCLLILCLTLSVFVQHMRNAKACKHFVLKIEEKLCQMKPYQEQLIGADSNKKTLSQSNKANYCECQVPHALQGGQENKMEWLEIVMEEYKTLREETLTSVKMQQSILSFGTATIGIVASAGFAVWEKPLLPGIIFLIVMPLIIYLIILIWLGEIGRMFRAGGFLFRLEEKVNRQFKDREAALLWETWLRTGKWVGKKPHHGIRIHYISIGVLLGITAIASIALGNYKICSSESLMTMVFINLAELTTMCMVLVVVIMVSQRIQRVD